MVDQFFLWLQHNSLIVALNSSVLSASILEVIHYFSIFVVVGAAIVLDLRLLGLSARSQRTAQLSAQLFPWVWTGLSLTVISGFIMFAGDASEYIHNSLFHRKLEVILLAAMLSLIVQFQVPRWNALPAFPVVAKIVAAVSLVSWVWAILMGVNVPALTGVG